MGYYILEAKPIGDTTPLARIEEYPQLPSVGSWFTGEPLTLDPATVIECLLEEGRPGYLPHFFDETIPMMSPKLLGALESAGVDNLQIFPAVLKLEDGTVISSDYRAINVVGIIAAADMDKSKYESPDGSGLIDSSFDSLTLDESKTGGHRLFRLAEAVTAIVIHEEVKIALEKADLGLIGIIDPKDWVC